MAMTTIPNPIMPSINPSIGTGASIWRATALEVCVTYEDANNAPVEVFLRRGFDPTLTVYDKTATFYPPGGCLSLTSGDSPPLQPGSRST